MILALALACSSDRDFDGFANADDCDPDDAYVYPGAPDDPGDGVDADCDGVDPAFAFLGGWTLTTLDTDYAGFALFEEGTASGSLAIADNLATTVTIAAQLNEEVVGVNYPVEITLAGWASPLDGPDLFTLYAETVAFDEQMHVDWDCAVLDGPTVACAGELKALEISIGSTSTYVSPL